MQAIAEAVSLGEHLRIDRNILLDALSRTTVITPAFGGKFQKIKDNDYSPEFPLRLMSKDMDLVMQAAKNAGADLPAARVAQSVLSSNLSSNGDRDPSGITPFIVAGQRSLAHTLQGERRSLLEYVLNKISRGSSMQRRDQSDSERNALFFLSSKAIHAISWFYTGSHLAKPYVTTFSGTAVLSSFHAS